MNRLLSRDQHCPSFWGDTVEKIHKQLFPLNNQTCGKWFMGKWEMRNATLRCAVQFLMRGERILRPAEMGKYAEIKWNMRTKCENYRKLCGHFWEGNTLNNFGPKGRGREKRSLHSAKKLKNWLALNLEIMILKTISNKKFQEHKPQILGLDNEWIDILPLAKQFWK